MIKQFKNLSWLLFIGILFGFAAATCIAASTPAHAQDDCGPFCAATLCGDTNNNGQVTASDALATLRIAVGLDQAGNPNFPGQCDFTICAGEECSTRRLATPQVPANACFYEPCELGFNDAPVGPISSYGPATISGAAVFNADCAGASCAGGDTDLSAPELGHVLIVPDGTSGDTAAGGAITIDFDSPVDFYGLTVLDIEEGGQVYVFDDNSVLLLSDSLPTTADGAIDYYCVFVPGASQVVVELNGSGAIDDIQFDGPSCR